MLLASKRAADGPAALPKRTRVRIPLGEAVCNAAQQLAGVVRLPRVAPNLLYTFVPLAFVRDPPSAKGDDDDDSAAVRSDDDSAASQPSDGDDSAAVRSDDDDVNDDDVNDDDDDVNDDDVNDDDDDGLVDDDDGLVDGNDDAPADDDAGRMTDEEASSDDDYASDWDGDSEADDDSDDESDDDDDDVVDLGGGLGVDGGLVATLYTTSTAALTAAILAHRSRRVPLQGVLLAYRQYDRPLELRISAAMFEQRQELGLLVDDEDDAPLAPTAGGEAAAAANGTSGGGGGDDPADSDNDDGGGDDDNDDDEDRLTAPDPAAAVRAGRAPTQPFPCQRSMIFYIRRRAEGNPACTEGEFAAMYADCPDGGNGWIDVDRTGAACVRMHWDSINEMMVRAGMTVVDDGVVETHLDTVPVDPVSNEPLVTDEHRYGVLRATETD